MGRHPLINSRGEGRESWTLSNTKVANVSDVILSITLPPMTSIT